MVFDIPEKLAVHWMFPRSNRVEVQEGLSAEKVAVIAAQELAGNLADLGSGQEPGTEHWPIEAADLVSVGCRCFQVGMVACHCPSAVLSCALCSRPVTQGKECHLHGYHV
jgi:hypothetical protein